MRSTKLFVLLVAALATWSCAQREAGPRGFEEMGAALDSLMAEHRVPGVAFAVFDDRGILYEHVAGVKNQEGREPIDPETVFEAASISKPVFAYIVFSLAGDGVLDLDAPLRTLVPDIPELSHDPRAATLTPRLLLTHQGGLPNWRSRINIEARRFSELFAPDDTLRFVSDPGAAYLYSGEGYVLLQRIVEARTGKSLSELASEIVFGPLGMTHSTFAFDDAARINYAFGHDEVGGPDKWELQVPLASSTLHTTATDLAMFGAHLASQVREGGPYAALATPAVVIARDQDVVRSWGPGLGIVDLGDRRYVYHGGNNVIFIADLVYGVEENLGYALLTNSSNGRQVVYSLERRVFGHEIPR